MKKNGAFVETETPFFFAQMRIICEQMYCIKEYIVLDNEYVLLEQNIEQQIRRYWQCFTTIEISATI